MLTYGFAEDVDVRAINYVQQGIKNYFTVLRPGNVPPLDITLNLPGTHNVLNALAAIAIATQIGVEDQAIVTALASFAGVGRRFQIYGEFNIGHGNVLLLDDYGPPTRD